MRDEGGETVREVLRKLLILWEIAAFEAVFGSRIIKRRESKICMFEKILSGRISGGESWKEIRGEVKLRFQERQRSKLIRRDLIFPPLFFLLVLESGKIFTFTRPILGPAPFKTLSRNISPQPGADCFEFNGLLKANLWPVSRIPPSFHPGHPLDFRSGA